jgi:hypothetical protein
MMPLFGNQQNQGTAVWEPRAAAVRRLADEHKLPETTPKPTFTLGLDA